MSVFGLIDESKLDTGFEVAQNPSTDFGDVFSAAFESTSRNFLFNSREFYEDRETEARDQKYKELTGRDLYEDVFAGQPLENRKKMRFEVVGKSADERNQAIDAYLTNLKAQDPERFKDIGTTGEIVETVKNKARESLARTEKAQAGATGTTRIAGSLAGGVAASAMDPLNLATLPLGAGPGASILRTAFVEAGVNAATEVVTHPFVSDWQRELGNEYGMKDLAQNAGMAAIFGAGMSGVMKGIPAGLAKARSLALTEAAGRFTELDNPVAATAATYEARRLHLEEGNPVRLSEAVSPEAHQRALAEVDAAANQGRAIDPDKIPVTDEQIRSLDRSKMDESTAKVHERLTENSPKIRENPVQNRGNEIFEFDDPPAPAVERQQQLRELYESPEYKAREMADFDEKVKASDERIWMDDETGGMDMSAAEIRKRFEQDEKIFSTISSCGLGGLK